MLKYSKITVCLACIIPCIFCVIVNGVIYIDTKVQIVLLSSCISTNFPNLAFSLLYITDNTENESTLIPESIDEGRIFSLYLENFYL